MATGARTKPHYCEAATTPPLVEYLDRTKVQQLVLEYATERAGDLLKFQGKELGLGVVNPRTKKVESSEEIGRAIEQAMKLYPKDKLFLNPDCGFGTFSNRPVNNSDIAAQKLKAIVSAARTFR